MQLLYSIESRLNKIKEGFQLPLINNSIESESVAESFLTNCKKDANGNIVYDGPSYIKTIDYQYWLLIFLLLNYPEIRWRELKLLEIIELFINRYKDKSFSYKDIEITKSGRTRCDTNIRIAFNHLYRLGLVNQYRVNKIARWSLTYLGFILAVSIIVNPDNTRNDIFSKQITCLNKELHNKNYSKLGKEVSWQGTLASGYPPFDLFILYRLRELIEEDFLGEILNSANLNTLGLPLLEKRKGSQIFNRYYKVVIDELDKENSKEKFFKTLYKRYDSEIDKEKELSKFMENLSFEFNPGEFINNLIRTVGGVTRSDSSS